MAKRDRDEPHTATAEGSTDTGEYPGPRRAADAPSAQAAIGPGDCLGRYTIRAFVGAGGMGRVFAAVDPELGRTVALKLIRPERSTTPRARARLMREAQAMARLHHPNVVTVHDVGSQGDNVFIAMELVEGPTLAAWLASGEHKWREVLLTFVAAGRGLEAAHAAGIVHRDFKPENVIVGKERVVVVDFGLARTGDDDSDDGEAPAGSSVVEVSLTLTGERLGTPLYMAPEQRAAGGVTAKSDQFSFCVALWESLHGARPADSASSDEPRRAEIPGWVNAALRRGLAIDPEQRWPSMRALLDALGRDPARTRRRALTAAGALGLVALSVVALARSHRDPCAGAAGRLAGVWDPARKEALRRAFAATNLAYATEAWQSVSARLDAYAAGWTNMYSEACRATRVEGRQSDTLLDLRMGCLDRRRALLGALGEVWARGMDAKSLEAATQATHGLAPLAECADARALTEEAPLPRDPALVARIATARAHVDGVVALNLAHHWSEARSSAGAVRAESDATGWPQVRAKAAFAEGVSLYELRDPHAEPLLLDAAHLAGEAHDDRLAARALIQLVEDLSLNEDTAGRALLVADIAEGIIARAGNDAALRGQLLHDRGETLLSEGKYDEAGAALRAAGAYFTTAFGAADAETTANTGQLVRVLEGQGNYAAARKLGEENLAATVATLGEKHPYVSVVLNNLAIAVAEDGDAQAAADYFRRALVIDEAVAGPDSERTANVLDNLGVAELGLGHLDQAQALLERADAIHARVLGPAHPIAAEARIDFATVRRKRGRLDEALQMLQQAVAILTKAYGPAYDGIAHALVGIGRVLEAKGDGAGALGHYQRALELCSRTLGAAHPRTLDAMNDVAHALVRLHRCAEAAPLVATASAGLEKTVGSGHPYFAAALAARGECELAGGRAAAAAVSLERAVAIVEKSKAAPVERGALRWPLARAWWAQGRRDAALAAAEKSEVELAADADGATDRAAAHAWLAAHRR